MSGALLGWLLNEILKHTAHEASLKVGQAGARGISRLSGHRDAQVAAAQAVAERFLTALKEKNYAAAALSCTPELIRKVGEMGGIYACFEPLAPPKSWALTAADDSGEVNKWGKLFALRLNYSVAYRKNLTGTFMLAMLLRDEQWKVDGWEYEALPASKRRAPSRKKAAPLH